MIVTPANTVFELLAFYVATYHVANNSIRFKNDSIGLEDTYKSIIDHKETLNNLLNVQDATIDKDTCIYCELLSNTVDHIIPQYHGGRDEPLNLVPCCKHCNSSKGKKDLFDWTFETNRRLSLNIVCRYLVLLIEYCTSNNILKQRLNEISRTSAFSLLNNFGMADNYAEQIKCSVHISLLKDMSLIEAIDIYAKDARFAVAKYLETVEINTWEDISVNRLENLRNVILSSVAPNSARTYFLTICALFYRFRKIRSIPPNYRSILYVRNDRPTQIFLTSEELKSLTEVSVNNPYEKYVKSTFFISAITGIKLSQIRKIADEDLRSAIEKNNYSISDEINAMISSIVNFNGDISLMTYGRVLRRLAQKAGINDMVNVHRKGEDIICQKYKCLTSSAAIYTYNAKLSKVNFENDGSLFDISVDCRVNLPFENWGSVDISAIVLEALERNNLCSMKIASKMKIKETELLSYIRGETPINLDILGKLMWILNLKLQ